MQEPVRPSLIHSNVNDNARDKDYVAQKDHDRIDEMLDDVEVNFTGDPHMFNSILKASMAELYLDCSNHTTFSTILEFVNLKIRYNMTDARFMKWLKLLPDMFPYGNTLPISTYEAKKLVCPIGMEYEKIHVCPNDCVLYHNEYSDKDNYPKCGMSCYKKKDSNVTKKDIQQRYYGIFQLYRDLDNYSQMNIV